MTAYYPSQAGYAASQQPGYGFDPAYGAPMVGSYAAPGPMYVPPSVPSYVSSHHGHRRHRRHSHHSHHYGYPYSAQPVLAGVPTVAGPVMMQPSYNGYYPYNPHSWGHRFRRFFGLAPNPGVRYKNDRSTWGFMGYSRRQRYVDLRTGGEVDRKGRPVYRV